MNLIGSKPFLTVLYLPSDQNSFLKRINPKYFHHIYFNFEVKLIVKTLFIKPLLP